jgi:hypothetical protein
MMAQPAASLDDIKETLSDHSDDVPEPEAKRQKIEEPTEAVANPEAEKKTRLKRWSPHSLMSSELSAGKRWLISGKKTQGCAVQFTTCRILSPV